MAERAVEGRTEEGLLDLIRRIPDSVDSRDWHPWGMWDYRYALLYLKAQIEAQNGD